jgi:hypothetical protein
MSVVSMLSGPASQPGDGIGVDADEPPGLSDAVSLSQVVQHGAGLVLGQVAVEQGRALAFGEAVLAGVAVEQPDVVEFAVAGADREVASVALAVEGAIRILAAEACEVVHAGCEFGPRRGNRFSRRRRDALPILR